MSIQNNCLNTYSMNKYLMDLVFASIEWVNPVAVLRHGYVFFVHGRKETGEISGGGGQGERLFKVNKCLVWILRLDLYWMARYQLTS